MGVWMMSAGVSREVMEGVAGAESASGRAPVQRKGIARGTHPRQPPKMREGVKRPEGMKAPYVTAASTQKRMEYSTRVPMEKTSEGAVYSAWMTKPCGLKMRTAMSL